MADQHDAGAQGGEFGLQPLDGGQVQVVGGLVEQEQVGAGCECAHQGRAPALAAREPRRRLVAGKPHLFQQGVRAIGIVARAHAGFHVGQHGGRVAEIGFLMQVADGGAGLQEAYAFAGGEQAGGDLQQGGFARTVAADQADPLACGHGQLGAVQQRQVAAQREVDVL